MSEPLTMDVVRDAVDDVNTEEEMPDEFVLAFDAISEDEKTISIFEEFMNNDRTDDIAIKVKEKAVYKIARLYTESNNIGQILSLMKNNSDNFFSVIAKAKTAKIIRNILKIVSSVPDALDIQISLCEDLISWCVDEKRTFLKQRIEAKYASFLLLKKKPLKALEVIVKLLAELKKLDDKQMLTEVHLTESRVYHVLENIPKSKASLTAARSNANSIYVVPLLQAELDEMSGILCCEEHDNNTSYSYFQEAFEAYDNANDGNAVTILKYMCLTKILNDTPNEVAAIMASKAGLKHAGPDLEALNAIANAVKAKSLEDFEKAVEVHAAYLKNDDLINHNLTDLYEKMFENNLVKIITPFSSVELAHVSKLINLPQETVERKLSQMILDRKISAILDQGKGLLEIFEEVEEDKAFTYGTEIITNMNNVVSALMSRSKRFNRGEVQVSANDDDKKDKKSKETDKEKPKSPTKKEEK
jgi:26S proteasome regulatory subunit N6